MPLKVRRIVTGPWAENCYLVSDADRSAVAIDPGDDAPAIVSIVRASRLKLKAILNTHGHHDHIGAVEELRERFGIPFCLHSGDAGILRQANLYRKFVDRAPLVRTPSIDRRLDGVRRMRWDGIEVEVLPSPGHTPGGVCFRIEDLLFTGDTLFKNTIGRSDLPGGDRGRLRRSLKRLCRLPARLTVYPGHGAPSVLGTEMRRNSKLIEAVS